MNQKSTNVFWEKSLITRQDREMLNGHKSFVLWFTGLSGSGKSTLAHAVEKKLHEKGCRTFVLDGDNVRHGLSSNLSFSEEDRKENIRRIGEAAKQDDERQLRQILCEIVVGYVSTDVDTTSSNVAKLHS